MLSDRRPILLTDARIIDPSRDLDFSGDLLIAEGMIREQVEMGVAVRMAVLEALSRNLPNIGPVRATPE